MPEFIKRLSCSSCHWKIPLFNHLTDDELCMMDANRHEVSFNTGEIILKQGAPLTHIVCLTRGLANIYIEGLRKRKLILRILKPTEIASDLACLSTINCITPSEPSQIVMHA